MTITTNQRGGVTILTPDGNLMGGPDASALNSRIHELVEKGHTHIVVDLGAVQFMNSSGLGLLIGAAATVRAAGGALRLANVPERIRSLLTITKLAPVLESFSTVEEAVTSYRK
jgi:anti-sigma B factor antagonist